MIESIILASVIIVLMFIIVSSGFFLYYIREKPMRDNEKSEREFELMREALQPSKMIKPPLMWTKENGFNRAPTLGEAMQFKPSDDGDEHNPMDTMC